MDISYLLSLQNIRETSELLTGLFNAVTYLGGSSLAVVIVSIIYWCINKNMGVRIGMSVGIGGIFNQLLKNICCINRPWIRDPRVIPDPVAKVGATGYSFPSGHSQTSMSVYGTIGASVKSTGKKIFFFALVLLVGFSRNFLGVHTPQDVLVGMTIGLVSIYFSFKVLDWAEAKEGRDFVLSGIMLAATVVFLIFTTVKPYPMDYRNGVLLVNPDEMITDCYKMAGVLVGISIGWILERRYVRFNTEVCRKTKIFRAVVGIPTMAAISFGAKTLGEFFGIWAAGFSESFFSIIFVIFVWPMIFKTVENKRSQA